MRKTYISIVIPVFNAEKTIERCIKSILMLNYDASEILVINDGSTDGTENIVNALASEDSRVRLYNQKNQGVSCARNKGIHYAQGEFVLFVDADDYLIGNPFEIINENCNSDIILFSFDNGDETCSLYEDYKHMKKETLFPIEGDLSLFKLSSPCSKAYRMGLLKESSISFDSNLKIGEDACFNFELFDYARKITLARKNIYFYDTSMESVTRRFNKDFLLIDYRYHSKMRELTIGEREEFEMQLQYAASNGLWRCCSDYFMNVNNHKTLGETVKELEGILKRTIYYEYFDLYRRGIKEHFGKGKFFVLALMQYKFLHPLVAFMFIVARLVRKMK